MKVRLLMRLIAIPEKTMKPAALATAASFPEPEAPPPEEEEEEGFGGILLASTEMRGLSLNRGNGTGIYCCFVLKRVSW